MNFSLTAILCPHSILLFPIVEDFMESEPLTTSNATWKQGRQLLRQLVQE